MIRLGAAADLNVIDRDPSGDVRPRYVTDFPADSGRFVIDAEGYVATVVNGIVMMREGNAYGRPSGSRPPRRINRVPLSPDAHRFHAQSW